MKIDRYGCYGYKYNNKFLNNYRLTTFLLIWQNYAGKIIGEEGRSDIKNEPRCGRQFSVTTTKHVDFDHDVTKKFD